MIALELEMQLQDLGYTVAGTVARIEDVLARARGKQFDGALLDVNLRGQQVFTILPELMEMGLALVITSGYDDATLFPAQFRSLPRIAKPFDKTTLQRVCRTVFGEPRKGP